METAVPTIQMVDLKGQYRRLKSDIDSAIHHTLEQTDFINGQAVKDFRSELAAFLQVRHVVTCANGTDALQIAMMGLNLQPGDEVIVPAFTYVATAEVIALLGLTPVWVDVDPDTFNVTAGHIAPAITERTKAIVPVHLFGQCADMQPILELAHAHDLFVIEDTAQAIGALYQPASGPALQAGTLGTVGCTSFFPSKNLGCYGDGGALYTNDDALGERLQMIANHGQRKKYVHEIVGVNSRLDTLQAGILSVKLAQLNDFNARRQTAAARYDALLADISGLQIPVRQPKSTHVFHQYTIKVAGGQRNALQNYLRSRGVPSMVYYPLPMHRQPAYQHLPHSGQHFPVAEALCEAVLSLPMHTELALNDQEYIAEMIRSFFTHG